MGSWWSRKSSTSSRHWGARRNTQAVLKMSVTLWGESDQDRKDAWRGMNILIEWHIKQIKTTPSDDVILISLVEPVVFYDEIAQELLRAGFWDDGQFGDIPGVERSPKRERKDREAPSRLRGSNTKIQQGGGLWVQKAKNNIRQNTSGHSWPHQDILC